MKSRDKYLLIFINSVILIDFAAANALRNHLNDGLLEWTNVDDVLGLGSVLTDSDLISTSTFLLRLLEIFQSRPLPMIYVEDIKLDEPDIRKRQHIDNKSPPTRRYICTPTREDIFKLLVALQEMRREGPQKSINFCNLERSTGAIFTNIRLLRTREITTPTPPR
ncbi:uncharacterized protein LOC113373826 [Ctenocephalides felis]|uniref:uncharacterized protein LOC113373826 n=1 Tax=Ctenocephalides felis TaxID=7515 RepID=UPI000E6E29D6|nr:uncharacterized protein LOC113373826 [Ctenocephalides felis]